jgi:regulator of protease activity HflC (stomatin/prohibitin superfamily)
VKTFDLPQERIGTPMPFHIAKEYERAIIFRLGRYEAIRGPGLFLVLPFLESYEMVDMRTVTVDVEPQEAITKDSVSIKVNAVLWYRISHPNRAVVSVSDYRTAVYQVAQTSLRNIIGQYNLAQVLKERDQINDSLQEIVDKATDPWGIKIEMIEMKDIEIPENMQRAMAREAEAEREKRARMIKSEGELEASMNLAQASRQIMENPISLELRRMQMLTEIGTENNTTTIVLMPAEFVTLAQRLSDTLAKKTNSSETGTAKDGFLE